MERLFKALNFFINIIFPQCCLICGKITKKMICDNCENDIFSEFKVKIERKNKTRFYIRHIYFCKYEKNMKKLILDYKFKDKAYLYKLFSKIIIKNKKICRILKSYDIIIPVPIHKKRKRERGYNQSLLIARDISENIFDLKLEDNVVIKTINNIKQSSLTKDERIKNVQGVYKISDREKISNKKVILFDDIYTTGNTVNEISKLLKQNGAKEITVLTIAKD